MFPIAYLPYSRSSADRAEPLTAMPLTRNLRAITAMVMAVALAVLAVAADQLIDVWEDHHLLIGWLAACGLVIGTAYVVAPSVRRGYQAWAGRRSEARSFARFMALASMDPRLMAEYELARLRCEQETAARQSD